MGWASCYGVQEFKKMFREQDEFIRSRFRSMQIKKWRKPAKFQRMMTKAGFPVSEARRTWVKMNCRQTVTRPPARFTMDPKWFRRLCLVFLDDYTQRQLKLELAR